MTYRFYCQTNDGAYLELLPYYTQKSISIASGRLMNEIDEVTVNFDLNDLDDLIDVLIEIRNQIVEQDKLSSDV